MELISENMKLEKLSIERQGYGPNKGSYEGSISFGGENGSINLILTPEISAEFLRFAGEAIRRASQDASNRLQESIELSIQAAQPQQLSIESSEQEA